MRRRFVFEMFLIANRGDGAAGAAAKGGFAPAWSAAARTSGARSARGD
jgi:hypothetical protein